MRPLPYLSFACTVLALALALPGAANAATQLDAPDAAEQPQASETQQTGPAAPAAPAPKPAPLSFGPFPPGWQIDVGPGILAVPRYPGSEALRVLPIPQLDIRYKNKFFASVQTGIGYNIVNEKDFRAGPIIRPEFGRTRRDIADFAGLERITPTAELGGFAAWQPDMLTTVQLEVRQAVSGHDGLMADLAVRRFKFKGKWTFAYGGRIRFAGGSYMDSYYGVTPAQSLTSGLAAYDPDGGINDVSVSAFASRRLGGKWSANAFASYSRLVGDAADAPITRSRFGSPNQFVLGTSISYRFRFD